MAPARIDSSGSSAPTRDTSMARGLLRGSSVNNPSRSVSSTITSLRAAVRSSRMKWRASDMFLATISSSAAIAAIGR